LEGTVAVAEKNAERIVILAGYGNVQDPIAIKISDDYRRWSPADRVVYRRLKGTVSVSQKDTNCITRIVRGDHVYLPVVIEVPNRHALRNRAGGRIYSTDKCACALRERTSKWDGQQAGTQ
jgi:hypothetical protein